MAKDKRQFYLGDKNLPTVDATFEFTPHMVKEIKKCSAHIDHFAMNYFYITSVDYGKTKIPLYAAQKRIIKTLVRERKVVVLASRQSGKCFCSNTKIKIKNKKTQKIEEITIKEFYERVASSQNGKRFS